MSKHKLQDCVDSFARVYPDLRKKALVLENISSPETIRNAAKLVPEDDFFQYEGLKIVSIGRLAPQKGYEIAIDAAAKIKKQGIEFVWYILGEGELRAELERLIKTNELVKEVKLVGIRSDEWLQISMLDNMVLGYSRTKDLDEKTVQSGFVVLRKHYLSILRCHAKILY